MCRPGGGQPIGGARHLAPPRQLVMHPYHVATFRVLFNPPDKLSYWLFNISDVFGRPGSSLRRWRWWWWRSGRGCEELKVVVVREEVLGVEGGGGEGGDAWR